MNEEILRYQINRPLFQNENFNILYPITPRIKYSDRIRQRWISFKEEILHPSNCKKRSLYIITNILPCISWLSLYNIKQYLLKDIIAGFTVAFMHIPQGMAYVALVPLPPVYGLYTSFFPVLIYFLFGTSKYISIGTYAVVSIMLGSAIAKHDNSVPGAAHNSSQLDPVRLRAQESEHLSIALSITALVGILELGLGLLHVGFVTTYMSTPVVRGFTTGAALHVFTSQLNGLFGIHLPRRDGMGKLIKTYVDFAKLCPTSNLPTLGLAAVSVSILVLVKALTSRYKNYIKFPIPIEFLLVLIGTGVSYFVNLQVYGVDVVGTIPQGMPSFSLPTTKYWLGNLGQAFAIAIVSFFTSFSMAKILGEKHEEEVDPNKELVAYGLSTVIGTFFGAIVSSASLSRSLVQEGVGGQTQVAGLVSCLLLLAVILKVGSIFKALPSSVLSAIIVVALRGMFYQLADVRTLFRQNKADLSIFLVTFLSTALLDVDVGLAVGIVYALITLVVRTQKPTICLLGRIPETDLYVDISKYPQARPVPGIKIYSFQCFIYYANANKFRDSLYTLCQISHSKDASLKTFLRQKNSLAGDDAANKTALHRFMGDRTLAGPPRNVAMEMLGRVREPTSWNNKTGFYDLRKHDMNVLDGSHCSFSSRASNVNGQPPDDVAEGDLSAGSAADAETGSAHHHEDDKASLVLDKNGGDDDKDNPKIRPSIDPSGKGAIIEYQIGSNGNSIPAGIVRNHDYGAPSGPKSGDANDNKALANNVIGDGIRYDDGAGFQRTEAVVIDCTYVTFLDTVALDTMSQVIKDLDNKRIMVVLAKCTDDAITCMEKGRFFAQFERRQIYLTIHDAIIALSQYI